MVKKEEETQSVPALVDYTGSGESGKHSIASGDSREVESWNSHNFEAYWKRLILEKWRGGGILFSLKDRTLISRMIKEFGADVLKSMLEWYVKTNDMRDGSDVGILYQNRHALYEQIKPKDYSDWLS